LLEGLRGADRRPGSFRTIQDYIAKPGQAIHDARFVPPPVTELSAALDQFEKFLNAKSGLPLLIELALTHYQFETIHPFVDGNGRIGRLLLSLLLCERGPLAKPLLCLSAYFEKNRERYVDLLLDVSRSGSWQEWIQFFLRGVASQSEDAILRSQKLLELWQQYRARMQTARASALALNLIDALFSTPVLTIPMAAGRLKVTYASAQLNVEKLVRSGILKEATGNRRNRVYVAPEILQIISSRETPAPAISEAPPASELNASSQKKTTHSLLSAYKTTWTAILDNERPPIGSRSNVLAFG
jgi:Fic family protein